MIRKRPSIAVVIAGVLVAALVGFVLAPHASGSPDGLERVAADHGLNSDVRTSAVDNGPLSDYQTTSIDDRTISTGVAALIGIAVTFALSLGLMWFVAVRRSRSALEPARR
ncbi:MAG TPA: PDGLE domain-containing protein [Ilumatobacteraceae bacterium]